MSQTTREHRRNLNAKLCSVLLSLKNAAKERRGAAERQRPGQQAQPRGSIGTANPRSAEMRRGRRTPGATRPRSRLAWQQRVVVFLLGESSFASAAGPLAAGLPAAARASRSLPGTYVGLPPVGQLSAATVACAEPSTSAPERRSFDKRRTAAGRCALPPRPTHTCKCCPAQRTVSVRCALMPAALPRSASLPARLVRCRAPVADASPTCRICARSRPPDHPEEQGLRLRLHRGQCAWPAQPEALLSCCPEAPTVSTRRPTLCLLLRQEQELGIIDQRLKADGWCVKLPQARPSLLPPPAAARRRRR